MKSLSKLALVRYGAICAYMKTNMTRIMSHDWSVKYEFNGHNIILYALLFFETYYIIDMVNALWPSDAIWRHESRSTLVSVHGLLPGGTKPLPEPMLTYHQSSVIHLRAISQEIPQPPFTKISLKITYLESNWNIPGANELNRNVQNITKLYPCKRPNIPGCINPTILRNWIFDRWGDTLLHHWKGIRTTSKSRGR